MCAGNIMEVKKFYPNTIPKSVYIIPYINETNIKGFIYFKNTSNIISSLSLFTEYKLPYEVITLVNFITNKININNLVKIIITQLYLFIISVKLNYKMDIPVLILHILCKLYYTYDDSHYKCIENYVYNICSHNKGCSRCIRNKIPDKTQHNVVYQTRPCIVFAAYNRCTMDTDCDFHHCKIIKYNNKFIYDPPIENIITFVPNVNSELLKSPNYKTTLCFYYINNKQCARGNYCSFAHETNELRKTISIPSFYCVNFLNGKCKKNNCNLRHTRPICNEFKMTNNCRLGNNCPFLHDNTNVDVNVKKYYKTVICNNMIKYNYCKYGDNCLFIHS